MSARNSAAAAERHKNTVKILLANQGSRAKKKEVTTVTAGDVEAFLTWRLNSGAAPKTAIVDLKTLNTAFRRAEAYGTILKSPVAAVQLAKGESSEREVFTHDEVQRLLDAAPTVEWRTLIVLGYFLGTRLGDCVHMRWENVRPGGRVIIYHQRRGPPSLVRWGADGP